MSFSRRREKVIILRDNRERRWNNRLAVRSVSSSRNRQTSIGELKYLAPPARVSRYSDAGTDSFRESDCTLDADSYSGSYEDLCPDMSNYMPSPNTDAERVPLMGRKKHSHKSLNSRGRSRSLFSLNTAIEPLWIVDIIIYSVLDINISVVPDGLNTCIKIKQNGETQAKTAVKPSSSQQVWEQTFMIPLVHLDPPLVFNYCIRKGGKFSTLGSAPLVLTECMPGMTYPRHLDILSVLTGRPIGLLRMQVCLRPFQGFASTIKSKAIEDSHRGRKSISRRRNRLLLMKQRSIISAEKRGPLYAGLKIFETRYMGLLHLSVVAHPSNVYARRWAPLEYQPGEVAVITNSLTKVTEMVSPLLPWPPHFLRGVSALQFDPVTGPQVAHFDSAVLYLSVLGACGLQSIPLAKFLTKLRSRNGSGGGNADSMHRGVVAAQLISYNQTIAKNAHAMSTQVVVQMGKDKFTTSIRRGSYNPVWDDMFTFYLTNSSNTLIELQLMSIANPNITGPAAGVEKIGEALIDVSRLPLDFTQRIEVELNGRFMKPRLLLLATLTGLARTESPVALTQVSINGCGPQHLHESFESRHGSLYTLSDPSSLELDDKPAPLQPPVEHCSIEETDAQIVEHYGWKMALENRFDVGLLRVNVIAASGLAVGKEYDPYCLLELINMRVQTQTVKRSSHPEWNKVFVFPVTDIHSVLYVTVNYEEKTKSEFLGRVAIPLLKIRNRERSWYALKNADLTERAKGSILLEFFFVYNHFKAAWRTLNPIEPCLKHPVRPKKYKKLSSEYKNAMQVNVLRLKEIFKPMAEISQIVSSICSWENPWYTIAALIGYNAVVWNLQPYMVPLGMVVGILASRFGSKNPHMLDVISSARSAAGVGASNLASSSARDKYFGLLSGRSPPAPGAGAEGGNEGAYRSSQASFDYDTEVMLDSELLSTMTLAFPTADEEETEKNATDSKESKDPNKGCKKFATIMDIIGDLPQIIDLIASAIEKTIGIFEWQVPWITWLCVIFLSMFTLILYFVPLRVVLCIVGTNQLTRKLLRPSSRYTCSTFNVISRIPSRPEIEQQRRLAPRSFVFPK